MKLFRALSFPSCQKAVLNELELGDNIARNTALSENVFMMVVCIELRIPLFVVGKPGSSKSLAKTVVTDNMLGDASRSDLFKTFKQVGSWCMYKLPFSKMMQRRVQEEIESSFWHKMMHALGVFIIEKECLEAIIIRGN